MTNATTVVDRELPAVLESVSFARDLAAGAVPGPVRHDVGRVVAQLVNDFVRKGCGPILLIVTADTASVRVEVSRAPCSGTVDDDGRKSAVVEIPVPPSHA
ncbi:MAG: hypothetical protein ACT4OX_15580 [Actinomycetota bacterium]